VITALPTPVCPHTPFSITRRFSEKFHIGLRACSPLGPANQCKSALTRHHQILDQLDQLSDPLSFWPLSWCVWRTLVTSISKTFVSISPSIIVVRALSFVTPTLLISITMAAFCHAYALKNLPINKWRWHLLVLLPRCRYSLST
jgi:hypothetical protein